MKRNIMLSKGNVLKEDFSFSKKELPGYNFSELQLLGGELTAGEIAQQPEVWEKTWQRVFELKDEIGDFLAKAFADKSLTVMLTGAGTSAYIGDVLAGPFHKNTGRTVSAVATTDLILHPEHYLNKKATLLVSFARSGDSPESLAAVLRADDFCEKVFHLIITCNPIGQLVTSPRINRDNFFVFLLPPEADDQSLAMTSSFTSMLLAGLLISRIGNIEELEPQVRTLAGFGRHVITEYGEPLREVASFDFQRAVFLGSGPLRSVALESELKLQELTDGQVVCKSDSFLGFRHGPKAVINPATLLVYLFSNNAHVHQYETDLVNAIHAGERGLFRIGVIEHATEDIDAEMLIEFSPDGARVDEEFLAVVSVLPAQLIGFYKSLSLGLSPDSPSRKETITRVVKGVTIYPFPK